MVIGEEWSYCMLTCLRKCLTLCVLPGRWYTSDFSRGLQAYFDKQATTIQRWFRGYYSRKYVHSFNDRKRYIQGVLETGTGVRINILADSLYVYQCC